MRSHQVIIVGGGPAGSTCAWKLQQAGVDCMVLDKADFPRPKTCAGWITPRVLEDLDINPAAYPYSLTRYPGLKIYLKGVPIHRRGSQYAIRREEFDAWLLARCGAPVETHYVRRITRTPEGFDLDGLYHAEILVGAGGTHCPVYHQFFKEVYPREGIRITALEEEFKYPWDDGLPRLWFFDAGLPGYGWYLPKEGGWLNLGVGGNQAEMENREAGIREHWRRLITKLQDSGLAPRRDYQPQGYVYYLRAKAEIASPDNIYLIGDAAGLATLDMGEGIGPAVRSGLNAAESILTGQPFTMKGLEKFSLLPGWLGWLLE